MRVAPSHGGAEIDEEQRLREAYSRRGPIESRLGGNRGQRTLVEERDRELRKAIAAAGRPVPALLEIGCGDGAIVSALVAEGAVTRGVGIDILPEQIELGREAHPDVELHAGDASKLPFANEEFDAVLASTVLSSVQPGPRRVEILREAGRVLKPGGVFVWYDMRYPSPNNPEVNPFVPREIQSALPSFAVNAKSVTLLPPIARRLGPLTDVGYRVLAAIPVFRSHTVGFARKPA